jgi:hypothetical protein
MRVIQSILVILVFGSVISGTVANAVLLPVTSIITIDERGVGTYPDGTPIPWRIGLDPGPGGLPNALIYLPQLSFVEGDVLLKESPDGDVSDVIRFNPDGQIVFYSDSEPGEDDQDLADTGFPTANYTNLISVFELGTEGNSWADYKPDPGMPGYSPNLPDLMYHIVSDIPEPSTFVLVCLAGISLVFYGWQWRRR